MWFSLIFSSIRLFDRGYSIVIKLNYYYQNKVSQTSNVCKLLESSIPDVSTYAEYNE